MSRSNGKCQETYQQHLSLDARINITVIGDSHGANVFDALLKAGISHRYNIHSVPMIAITLGKLNQEQLLRWMIERLKTLNSDVVVTCFGGSDIDFKSQYSANPLETLLQGVGPYSECLQRLSEAFERLIVVLPFPPCTKDSHRQDLYERGLSSVVANKLKVKLMAARFPSQNLQERSQNAQIFNKSLRKSIEKISTAVVDVWPQESGLINQKTGILHSMMQREDDHHLLPLHSGPALIPQFLALVDTPVWSDERSSKVWGSFKFDIEDLGNKLMSHRDKFLPFGQETICRENWSTHAIRLTYPSTCEEFAYDFDDLLCPELLLFRNALLEVNPKILNIFLSHMGPRTSTATHSGFSDVSSHVIRCHLPIFLPEHCQSGIVIDGRTFYHRLGSFLCFDDTFPHSGFNRSSTQDRIVIIIDIARPPNAFPYSKTYIPTDELTMSQIQNDFKTRPHKRIKLLQHQCALH